VALSAGRRLRPQDIGLAAALGFDRLGVFERLRVALFSTGDELREPGAELPAGAIYDANRHALRALLGGLGCVVGDLGILPDRQDAIRDALEAASREHDLLVTSGGMSVGEEDHVKAAVESLGTLNFWRLAIKPGRPVALGRVAAAPFIGLPGNPVAVIVTFVLLARPLILRLAGAREAGPRLFRVRAGFDFAKKPGRREFLRARLEDDPERGPSAILFPRQGSGILSSITGSDGLVVLAEGSSGIGAGEMVDFLPFGEAGG
jgi:molybdopterin molybdotransferase